MANNGEGKALAMMEFKSIGRGMACTDRLLKDFPVELIFLRILCPGKLLVAITGEIAAIRSALEVARSGDLTYIDDFFLGNPSPNLLSAMRGTTPVEQREALAIVETFTASQALLAADVAVKAAGVTLANLHIARGLAGKAHVFFTGSLGRVEVALEAIREQLHRESLAEEAIIASPDGKTWAMVW
ncbi:MAG: BMC domain-containing protein [Firmicutes bacterium]|nr:BMC domain-containing protein [Bacillota bacterium]